MDRATWTSFLLLMISLFTVDFARGSCDLMNPPCPPPFPDFLTLFAETLKNIPDLLVDNQISSSADCPETVNWTVFNWNLEAGSPLPLDPECSPSSTPYPTAGNQSNPSGVPATSIGFPNPTNPSGSTLSTTLSLTPVYGEVSSSGGTTNIGMAVGIAVGGAVLLVLIVIIAVVCFRRYRVARRKKEGINRQFLSTTSHDVLVTALEIGMPDTPQAQQTVVILSDSTFQESSTDPTLQRSTTSIDVVVIEKKFPDEMEAAGGGCRNKAFDALEEDSEDNGYAGSEACQENWENEWNNKFEEALMENDEFPSKDAEEGEASSDSHEKEKFASRISSKSSKNLSSLKKRPSPSLSASSSRRNSQVLDFRMPSSTRSDAFSAGNSSLTKRSTSPFSRPSATNWPTSGKIDTDVVVATVSRSSFEKRSPSLTPTSDGPPAYSSPIIKPNEGPPFPRQMMKPGDSLDQPTPPETPQTPSGLPTYSEIMAVRDAPEPSSHPFQPASPQKQQRPVPPKKQLISTKAPPLAAAATPSSAMPPPNPLKSQAVESLVERNPNPWKTQAKLNGKTNNSEPVKPSNTAVVRPWTTAAAAGRGQASDGRPSTVAAPVPPPLSTPAAAARPSDGSAAASVATASESTGDYSSRPVRSLLSQFETLDRKNP